jgi:hypothetical protein
LSIFFFLADFDFSGDRPNCFSTQSRLFTLALNEKVVSVLQHAARYWKAKLIRATFVIHPRPNKANRCSSKLNKATLIIREIAKIAFFNYCESKYLSRIIERK